MRILKLYLIPVSIIMVGLGLETYVEDTLYPFMRSGALLVVWGVIIESTSVLRLNDGGSITVTGTLTIEDKSFSIKVLCKMK